MTSLSVPARPVRAARPAVSLRVLLLVAVAVVAGLLTSPAAAGPAAAGPQRGLLVVEGLGGSSAELVVPRRLQLQQPLPELTGGREYAAVLFEPVSREPGGPRPFGAVQVRAFGDRTSEEVALLDVETDVQPGTYRVTLLGQGPVRAAYRLADPDEAGVVLSPRKRIAQQFFGRAEPLTFGYSQARVDLPGVVPPGRRVVQVGLLEGISGDDYRMCVTAGEGCSRRLTPLCPPAVACPTQEEDLPRASVTYEPSSRAVLTGAVPVRRSLRWTVQGYREAPGKLRAAAIVF